MSTSQDQYMEAALLPDYILNEFMAEKAVKTVLGIFTSKLSDEQARRFTSELPDYLDYDVLRGHQENPTPASLSDCIEILREELEVEEEQAYELMMKIISVAKQQTSGEINEVATELSEDWQEAVHRA